SVREDSLETSRLSAHHLGSTNSTEFGKTTSSLALSFSLPTTSNFVFPAVTNVDSVVLVLEYASATSYNGDLNSTQEFEVFEITNRLYKDSLYFSTSPITYNVSVLGSYAARLNPKDSFVHVFNSITVKQSPQMRISLDK